MVELQKTANELQEVMDLLFEKAGPEKFSKIFGEALEEIKQEHGYLQVGNQVYIGDPMEITPAKRIVSSQKQVLRILPAELADDFLENLDTLFSKWNSKYGDQLASKLYQQECRSVCIRLILDRSKKPLIAIAAVFGLTRLGELFKSIR